MVEGEGDPVGQGHPLGRVHQHLVTMILLQINFFLKKHLLLQLLILLHGRVSLVEWKTVKSLFVSLLNCSFSLLSTTAVKVGTARPRCTTKPSWSWVTPASVRLLGWLAANRQKEAKMRTKIEKWLKEARIVGNESCTTVMLKTYFI